MNKIKTPFTFAVATSIFIGKKFLDGMTTFQTRYTNKKLILNEYIGSTLIISSSLKTCVCVY